MKFYRHWIKEKREIRIDNESVIISLLVGSDISKLDASENATKRAQLIEDRIAHKSQKEEYSTEIKEYIHEMIDSSNVVSINRYGAKVLNSSAYTILDLDDYPVDLFDFFGPVRKLEKKARIIFKFKQRLLRYPELGSNFRIYETAKGIRVIGNKFIDPVLFGKVLRKLNVDWLYLLLSQKQGCYRARLTPKPYRMKIQTIRIRTPLDCETDEYRAWEKNYTSAAVNYSVVKLREQIGVDFSADPVIALHDRIGNLSRGYQLA